MKTFTEIMNSLLTSLGASAQSNVSIEQIEKQFVDLQMSTTENEQDNFVNLAIKDNENTQQTSLSSFEATSIMNDFEQIVSESHQITASAIEREIKQDRENLLKLLFSLRQQENSNFLSENLLFNLFINTDKDNLTSILSIYNFIRTVYSARPDDFIKKILNQSLINNDYKELQRSINLMNTPSDLKKRLILQGNKIILQIDKISPLWRIFNETLKDLKIDEDFLKQVAKILLNKNSLINQYHFLRMQNYDLNSSIPVSSAIDFLRNADSDIRKTIIQFHSRLMNFLAFSVPHLISVKLVDKDNVGINQTPQNPFSNPTEIQLFLYTENVWHIEAQQNEQTENLIALLQAHKHDRFHAYQKAAALKNIRKIINLLKDKPIENEKIISLLNYFINWEGKFVRMYNEISYPLIAERIKQIKEKIKFIRTDNIQLKVLIKDFEENVAQIRLFTELNEAQTVPLDATKQAEREDLLEHLKHLNNIKAYKQLQKLQELHRLNINSTTLPLPAVPERRGVEIEEVPEIGRTSTSQYQPVSPSLEIPEERPQQPSREFVYYYPLSTRQAFGAIPMLHDLPPQMVELESNAEAAPQQRLNAPTLLQMRWLSCAAGSNHCLKGLVIALTLFMSAAAMITLSFSMDSNVDQKEKAGLLGGGIGLATLGAVSLFRGYRKQRQAQHSAEYQQLELSAVPAPHNAV